MNPEASWKEVRIAAVPSALSRASGDLRGRFCRGNSKHEHRAAFGLVLASDLSAVILDHAIYGAEAQTSAFADGLGGVEGIENPQRVANAGAGIGKLEHGFFALASGR